MLATLNVGAEFHGALLPLHQGAPSDDHDRAQVAEPDPGVPEPVLEAALSIVRWGHARGGVTAGRCVADVASSAISDHGGERSERTAATRRGSPGGAPIPGAPNPGCAPSRAPWPEVVS